MSKIDNTININDVMYDRVNKELVLISNQRCTLPHENTTVFNASHDKGMASCIYVPHECIVLRVIGQDDKGRIRYAYTYRGVNAKDLEPVKPETAQEFKALLSNAKHNIGRI